MAARPLLVDVMPKTLLAVLAALALPAGALAAPVKYKIDADHTYPSFEADHMGISVWRGKMNKSSGLITLDKEAGTGSVDVTIDLSSIDFGQAALNKWAVGPQFFNVKKYPKATYSGTLAGFSGSGPAQVDGQLTLHGVTRPVPLKVQSWKCVPHPMLKRDYCGADALVTFKRDEFGLDMGRDYGFSMDVTLRIQVEALKTD